MILHCIAAYTCTMFWFFLIFLNIYLFLRDRGRQSMSRGGGERERETQNLKQAPGSELFVTTEPDAGLELTNCKIMT